MTACSRIIWSDGLDLLSFDFLVDFLLLFNSIVAVVMGWFFHISVVARALIGKNA